MTARQIAPGRHRTVVELHRTAAELNPDVEAYVEPEGLPPGEGAAFPAPPDPGAGEVPPPRRSVTFSEWDRAADGLAGLLAARGVGRGDVVCLVLPSSIDYAVCYAAALRLGAITSGVNPRLGRVEIESIVHRARPVLTVVDPALGVELPPAAGAILTRGEAAGAWSGPPPSCVPVVYEDDPVAVVWTSGTTGRPKGAVFDHRCLLAASDGAGVLSRPGDRRLSPLPFAHVGYMTKVWDEIAHGVTTIITPSPWRAADALRIMEVERVTVAQGVPTQWALLLALDALDRADLSSLRIAGTGAAPMPAGQVSEIRRRLGVPVVVRYASTETAICTGTVPEDPDEVVAGTVGRPVPGVELLVVGDDGQPVAAGRPGRVRIRSGAVMLGYWGPSRGPGGPASGTAQRRGAARVIDAEATAGVRSSDGWVFTGDLGTLDGEGNLRLVGREHERYIRGGYNVYPGEVEDVLSAHPAVERVAVLGIPDPVLGEVGVAFVVPAPGVGPPGGGAASPGGDVGPPTQLLADLRRYCAERLADYKAPDALVTMDSLPLTPMMKVDKRSLEAKARAAATARRSAG